VQDRYATVGRHWFTSGEGLLVAGLGLCWTALELTLLPPLPELSIAGIVVDDCSASSAAFGVEAQARMRKRNGPELRWGHYEFERRFR
jgi:hypothetical protein